MLILGIETSCDETSASLVNEKNELLSNIIISQDEIHKEHGGIIPELASRQHVKIIDLVIQKTFQEASASLSDLDVIGVTNGPGLAGSLIVGVNYAKGLGLALTKPVIGVNHLKAHAFAAWITKDLQTNKEFHVPNEYPLMCLIVSGGHTDLVLLNSNKEFELIGRTRDDAAGEAFDKAARLLGLGFPGGPQIDKFAKLSGEKFNFPRAFMPHTHDFSFSGMKTAFLKLSKSETPYDSLKISKLCNTFQEAIVDVLTKKTINAAHINNCKGIVLTGGVAANSWLREEMVRKSDIPVYIPEKKLCTDNGAMVASFVSENYNYKSKIKDINLDVFPSLSY
jgi:N6-L-threonylcarbamoyladenine synthase|tara:strand:+ start:404 stop:1417 length:1014 start_codon:yes stop_codon:yes gene_type:complete